MVAARKRKSMSRRQEEEAWITAFRMIHGQVGFNDRKLLPHASHLSLGFKVPFRADPVQDAELPTPEELTPTFLRDLAWRTIQMKEEAKATVHDVCVCDCRDVSLHSEQVQAAKEALQYFVGFSTHMHLLLNVAASKMQTICTSFAV